MESNMEQAVQRLRTDSKEEAEEARSIGVEAGEIWAMQWARASELRALARIEMRDGRDWSPLERLAKTFRTFEMLIDDLLDRDDDGSLRQQLTDDRLCASFIAGFVERACEVWDEVEADL